MDSKSYLITVDYSLSLEEMIESKGFGYGHLDLCIRDGQVPIIGEGVVTEDVLLFPFDGGKEPEEAIAMLDQKGRVPVQLAHILALSMKFPDLFQEFYVLGLGSPWIDPTYSVDKPLFPCLGDWGHGRGLRMSPWDVDWCKNPRARVAGIQKT